MAGEPRVILRVDDPVPQARPLDPPDLEDLVPVGVDLIRDREGCDVHHIGVGVHQVAQPGHLPRK